MTFGFLVALFLVFSAAAEERSAIRLRNETIHPDAKGTAVQRHGAHGSGLFLLQFSGPVSAQARAELGELGVQLLRYVSPNAFVVRLNKTDLGQLEALPFVTWIGRYKPEHKVHSKIAASIQKGGGGAPLILDVKVLLAPNTAVAERNALRALMQRDGPDAAYRFGHVLSGGATAAQIQALAARESVLWIEAAPAMKLFDEISSKITGGDDGVAGTPTIAQQLGYDGSGVVVAVADSGLDSGEIDFMHTDLAGRVDALFYYGALTGAEDEHRHGTHVTGIIAGDATIGEVDDNGYRYGLGVAPEAHIIGQRIFDGDGAYHAPPTFEVLTHDAVRAGAHIGSNSWGDDTQGRYDLSAAEFDALVRDADTGTPGDQQYILEFSAGNAGPGQQTIGSPAVAKNVIASGAAENDRFDLYIYDSGRETMADFSSRGPCEDGRIKPDVTAAGTWIASLRSIYANDDNAWAPISANYLYQGGTSQSGPHISGAAAIFVQYYRETITNQVPSPALVKAALINCAVDMDESGGTEPIPNNDEGWGRVDLAEMIDSPRRFEFVDQAIVLTQNQVFEKHILIASSDEPLKVTLAYTDVPALPAAIPALVNDLDLEVIGPDGSVFRGNQFDAGESMPNAPSADRINNVEAVHIAEPAPGEYLVRVRAYNVAEDARADTGAIDQDFGLVISADIPLPGMGIVFFDKSSYRASVPMRISVIDFDLIGQSTVTVALSSSTESVAETVLLQASAPGSFTGTVMTATGPAQSDGNLQIAHGDTIQVMYVESSPAGNRIATARADLIAPVISNVWVTNRYGNMVVSWQTDEPANSIVRYGTNATLNAAATNHSYVTTHEVALGGLVSGTTYYFLVNSSDDAGNSSTNNNGGALFSFVAVPPSTILLIDDYTDAFFEVPPLSGYTDALQQVGLSYEVWDTSVDGSPTFNDLKSFRVVIWRLPEFVDTFTASERTAITNYLANGGSLLVASMEVLTRLTEANAGWFITNVFHVTSYTEDTGVPDILGLANDPISSGTDMTLDYTPYEDEFKVFVGIPADISDSFVTASDAVPILLEPSTGATVGSRFPRTGVDSPGRVVFLSFPLDTIPMSGPDPNNRPNLLRNLLGFLAPGANGLGTIALDNSAYSIPAQVIVEVADSDLAGAGQTTISMFSDTVTNGVSLTMNETVRPGLFRGFLSLVGSTNAPASGKLPVSDGDDIWGEYFDASSSGITRAYAVIDAVPAVISNVASAPDYEEALITWTTSKPTDGLVKFGESTFLGRTSYRSEFVTEHEVLVSGLQPNRTYYYQVVSRDVAGNVTVDDNNGAFYTFHTATPLNAPWSDNLESGATNWVVVDGEPGASWQLGQPANSLANEANSPTNAWGSNLSGENIDIADTTLASPAVYLTGGNRATLRFWQNYDFTSQSDFDIYEFGQVYISTNNGNAWTLLSDLEEFSFGWEEAEIDLTPYLGHVVRIGFYYGFFSLDSAPHPGWLIDDVSITVSSPTNGTIRITNNLAQAQFQASGPTPFSGNGWETVISNAAAGSYTVTYDPVPFYQTPSPQTNTLATGGLLTFLGLYTFADSNTNGISDTWEQSFFGEVSTNRTASTDSDGDGFTDFAEFQAGTNPTNALSALRFNLPLLPTNGMMGLSWSSVPGRAYQVLESATLVNWFPASPWLSAAGTNSSIIVPHDTNSPALFRLQVRP